MYKKIIRSLIYTTLVLAIAGTTVAAPPAHRGPALAGHGKKDKNWKHDRRGRSEVVIVRDYYSARGLPPGLAKRGTLPPGLQRQLVVGGHLPPGLERRLYPVPDDLVVILPRLPYYQRRFFLGADLLIVDTRRNVIVNIVADVLR